jgi:hypothetical protein
MRARLVLATATAAALSLLLPGAHAAGPQVTDPASDANHINDNAPIVLPVNNPANNNPTPVGSDDAADILSIEWKTTKKKATVTGFQVVMTLKAAPTKSGLLYRATSETADCSTLWFQYYSSNPGNTPQGSLRHTCDGSAAVVAIPTKVVKNTIVWDFAFADKNMPRLVKTGTEIIELGGHSREFVTNPQCVDVTRCTTNPIQADVTDNVPGPYKVGS